MGVILELVFVGLFFIGVFIFLEIILGSILGIVFVILIGESIVVVLVFGILIVFFVFVVKNLCFIFVLFYFVYKVDKYVFEGNLWGISWM